MTQPVMTVVTFTMPATSREAFKREWLLDAPFMALQPGQQDGALCMRVLEDDQVEFVNVARWDTQVSLDAARQAVMRMRSLDGRNQDVTFKTLGVTWNAQDYLIDTPYGHGTISAP